MSPGTRSSINHYEELGVEPNATSKEIRAALRKLSSLLHPDRCSDPKLRRLAEIQSKRINSIRAVLLDSASRSAYDESLHHVDRKCQTLILMPNPVQPARIPTHTWP